MNIENNIDYFSSYDFKDDHDIAIYCIGKSQLKQLYSYGINDYNIDFDFNQFVRYIIGTDPLPYKSRYSSYNWSGYREESTKYQKLDHHEKKVISHKEMHRQNWRLDQKINKDKAERHNWHRGRYYDWGKPKHRVLENIRKKEAEDEISIFLECAI
jgi:hypothetical protein